MAQVTASGSAGLQQDAGDHGGNAKAQIGGLAALQLHRGAAGDDLFDAVFGQRKTVPGPHDLARDRRIIGGFGGLALIGIDHDQIDQMARHMHVMGAQRAARGDALDLRDDQPAVVLGGDRLFHPAQIGAFVFIGQVAMFIGGRRPDDGHVGDDIGEMQPGLAIEFASENNGFGGTLVVHRAAFADRVDEGFKAHLRQHTRTPRARVAVHVEHDPRGHVIGGDPVFDDHAPDLRHRQRGRPRRIGPGDDLRQQPVLGQMVDPLDAIHVARRDRMQRGQVARVAFGIETGADGGQHRIRAAQTRG